MFKSLPGLQQLANDQPNSECECRNRLEVKQRFDADAADLSQISHRTDPVHDGAKDDRPDHHLDEGNKAVAERLESFAQVRPEMANKNANSDSYQNLDVEDRIPRAVRVSLRPQNELR